MLKKLLLTTVTTILFISHATAADIYIPAISVSDYQRALKNNEDVVFESTKLPDELKSVALKTFGSSINQNANTDQVISPQIILGSNASRGEYPEFTLLLVENNGSFFPICGATLIDDRKVLTAAHCSVFSNDYFFIPDFYAFSDFQEGVPSSQLFPASSKNIHPDFTETSRRLDHDIAVFTLTKSASSEKAVLYNNSDSLAGFNGTVIGVGLLSSQTQLTPNVLQEVSAPIVSNSVCQSAWGSGVQITSTVICAGFRTSDRGSCNGDSGGPLWATVDEERVQVGIVSFGPVDCSDNSRVYSGYARISELTDFVKQFAPGASFSSKTANITPIYPLLLD